MPALQHCNLLNLPVGQTFLSASGATVTAFFSNLLVLAVLLGPLVVVERFPEKVEDLV